MKAIALTIWRAYDWFWKNCVEHTPEQGEVIKQVYRPYWEDKIDVT